MSKDHTLFSEFSPVSTEEWEKIIEKDLRGQDYKQKLNWHTGEGIDILPFYRSEDLGHPTPALFSEAHDWEIRQYIDQQHIDKANQVALQALEGGADSLTFSLDAIPAESPLGGNLRGTSIQNQEAFSRLLKGIDLQKTKLHFDAGLTSPVLLAMLHNEMEKQGIQLSKISGSFLYDPYAFMLTHGRLPNQEKEFINQAQQMVVFCDANLPNIKSLGVDARMYHQAGGTIAQELGYALASGSEYLATLTKAGLDADSIASSLHFNLAVGSNYFLEIAKFRAMRKLWQNVLNAYGVKGQQAYIHGSSSAWNKTAYDPYINMLRTTTEGMSAAMAGCDAITLHPFDDTFRQPDEFSQRIARNAQIILKEEAYLDKVSDPAAGSYYIEKITDEIAEKAWTCFQEIEQQGGMLEALINGYVQTSIEASRNERDQAIATRKRIFVGTNQYPKVAESTDEIIKNRPATSLKATDKECNIEAENLMLSLKKALNKGCSLGDVIPSLIDSGEEDIQTITTYRGPQAFEELRHATEKHNGTPVVLTLPIGSKKMRKARSSFALNFFGCVGYKINDPIGFDSMDEAINQIKENNPDIVVLCSSDEAYQTLVPELCKRVKKIEQHPIIVLAGYPKDQIEHYKKAGIDVFIHTKCNVLETLKDFQQKLGVIER